MGKLAQAWARGAGFALAFGVSILLWGAAAYLVVGLVSYVLGGLGERAEQMWLVLSAVVWLPLAIGTVWPSAHSIFAPRDSGRQPAV